MWLRSLSVLIVASLPLAACTYDEGPDPSSRFLRLGMDAPQKNTVVVCSRLRLQDENTLPLHERKHCGDHDDDAES